MIGDQLSLILLPTNKCNVACEYCFEDKTADFMTLDQLSVVIDKLLDHMDQQQLRELIIYWQGGEAMLMQPEWFEAAHELISRKAEGRGKCIGHSLQSNMIGYSRKWNKVIVEMFGNSVGTSMDFPNLYRKSRGHAAGGIDRTRDLRRLRLPLALSRRLSGAGLLNHGRVLCEGSVL